MRCMGSWAAVAALPWLVAAALPVGAQVAPPQTLTVQQSLASGSSTVSAAPARAQPQRLDQIEVRGAGDMEQRRQSTASKIIVSRDELMRQGDTTIAEALKRLPGVTSSGPPGRGGSIRMRGLGAGYTRILLNGERLPAGFDLDSLSPEVVERIEVLRSTTAEFSSQAVAGVINIVTTTQVSRDVREMTFGGGYENGRTSPQVGVRYSGSTGSVTYAFNGQMSGGRYARESSAIELAKDANGAVTVDRSSRSRSNSETDQLNLAPRWQWNIRRGESLTVEPFVHAQRSRSKSESASETRAGIPAPFASAQSEFASESSSVRTALRYTRPFADGGKVEASFTLSKNQSSSTGMTLGRDTAGAALLERKSSSESAANGWSSRGKVTVPYIKDHDAAFGWDVSTSSANSQSDRRETSFTSSIVADSVVEEFFSNNKRLALFGQDEWKLGEQFSLYAGTRWEGVRIEAETRGNPLLNPSFKSRSAVFSPSVQSLYKFGEKNSRQLRFALSRTYREPSTSQLTPRKFVAINNSPISPDSQGNPDLKPELAWGIDLGFEQYLPESGILGVNLFYRDINDVFRNSIALVNGRWLRQPINNGKARTLGIELESKFNLRTLDATWPKINVRSNLALYRSVVDNIPGPNNRLEQQVPAAFNLGGDWTATGMPLTLGGNLNVNTGGEARTAANQVVYASVKRGLDMYAQWKFNPQSSLRVSMANMLAQDSISSNTVTDPQGGTDAQTTLVPTKPILRALWTQRF